MKSVCFEKCKHFIKNIEFCSLMNESKKGWKVRYCANFKRIRRVIDHNSMPALHKDLWKLCSEYNRRKFADKNGYVFCVCCGRPYHWKEIQAGHFISKGESKYLMYLNMNINPQCGICNYKSGSSASYRVWMIGKYGESAVVEMEGKAKYPAGFTREGLQLRIEEYKVKLKELDEKGVI
jgi:hypothetical protein